jgi:pimeloyl-ACP methyl ester carboxylesterase
MTTLAINTIRLSTGVTLEYVEQGSPTGVPVLCLHGVTDSWHSFEFLLPHLRDHLRVFAITQRGHGGSSKPETGYRYVDFAADVRAFMDARQLSTAVIVGHSMGSMVAQRFAIDYPDRVQALALLGAFLTMHRDTGIDEFWRTTLSQLTDPVPRDVALDFQLSTLATSIPQAQLELFVSESQRVPAHVWRATFREFLDTDFSGEVATISTPALMLWGEKDAFCGPPHWAGLQRAIPHARASIYESVGHALHWEQPERVSRDILAFIRSSAG